MRSAEKTAPALKAGWSDPEKQLQVLRLVAARLAQDDSLITRIGTGGTHFCCSSGLGEGLHQAWQIFPEKFAAVDDFAVAHVEKIDGEAAVFKVIAEDVGIIVEFDSGDALLLLELVHGGELIAQARGGLELLGFGGSHHARGEGALQLGVAAFEKQLRVADGLLVGFGRGEAFNAGTEAAMNVVLQAGARMIAREIDFATGQEKTAMDELDHAIGEVAGEVRAVISRAVFAQAARDEDFGEAVGEGELDVGVGLVVAQQNVEARLALLDEIVFEREGFVLVGDEDGIRCRRPRA